MKNIQTYKQSAEQIFTIKNLAGGLNKKASVYDISDSEAVGLINFIFTETGVLKVRNGYKKYNESVLVNPINSLYRFYKSDGTNKYFVATSGTGIYYDNSGTFNALTCDVTLTTNKRFQFKVFDNLLLMTNGANKPLKWLGGSSNHVKEIGIVAPEDGADAAESSEVGSISGTYLYKLTYYNNTPGELTESNASGAFGTALNQTITVTDKNIELTLIPTSTDEQVTHVRIYRTLTNDTTYYYVGAVTNGTATYTDIYTDDQIRSNETLITNSGENDPPPTDAKYIEIAKTRVFLFNNSTYHSRLYWSEIDNPEYFGNSAEAINNWRDINIDDGDVGTGLIYWNDYLYLFKENSTWALTDPADPEHSDLRNVSPTIGCVSPYTIQSGMFQRPLNLPGGDYILTPGIICNTRFGVMGFDGSQYWPLSERVEPVFEKLYETNIKEMVGFFNNNKYYLSYTPKEGTITDGGFVKFNQYTSDSGSENKDATYNNNYDENNFQAGTDARIDLEHTSAANNNVLVNVYIDWPKFGETEKIQNQGIFYAIFFSYDNAITWKLKSQFIQHSGATAWDYEDRYGNRRDEVQNITKNISHQFFDSNVTNVRLDYVVDTDALLDHANFVRLTSVSYFYEYSAAITGSNVVNNKILYYDTLHNAWSELQGIKANCFCAWNGSQDQREEFFGSSDEGYVYKMNVGSDDNGNEIFALYQSKHFDCQERSRKKRFHQLNISTDVFNSQVHLDVFVDRVQKTSWKVSLIPASDETPYWNEKYFNDITFDSLVNIINKNFVLPSSALGKFIGFQIWTSAKEQLAIKDYSIRYLPRESMR